MSIDWDEVLTLIEQASEGTYHIVARLFADGVISREEFMEAVALDAEARIEWIKRLHDKKMEERERHDTNEHVSMPS